MQSDKTFPGLVLDGFALPLTRLNNHQIAQGYDN
jgi:hypothetical protein